MTYSSAQFCYCSQVELFPLRASISRLSINKENKRERKNWAVNSCQCRIVRHTYTQKNARVSYRVFSFECRTNSHEFFCFVVAEAEVASVPSPHPNHNQLDQCSMVCCKWRVRTVAQFVWLRSFGQFGDPNRMDLWSTNKVYLFNQIEEIIFRLLEQQLAYCGFFLHRRTHHALIDALNSCVRESRPVFDEANKTQKKIPNKKYFPIRFSTTHYCANNRIAGQQAGRQAGRLTGSHVLSYSDCSTRIDGRQHKGGEHLNYFHSIQCRSLVCAMRAPPVSTDEFMNRILSPSFICSSLTPNCIQFEQMMIVFDAKWEYWNQFVFCVIW